MSVEKDFLLKVVFFFFFSGFSVEGGAVEGEFSVEGFLG